MKSIKRRLRDAEDFALCQALMGNATFRLDVIDMEYDSPLVTALELLLANVRYQKTWLTRAHRHL